ncbi:hypothetical protein FRB96_000949 [Tulasnella sp. 330]|nr:hypothetical protein FRB96_000949 [Tulasnella sp. 330]KAG8876938.1 hypothetical protein FRB97_003809 [Tulasnella sp. 331]
MGNDIVFDEAREAGESSETSADRRSTGTAQQAQSATAIFQTGQYYSATTTSTFPEVLGKGKACLQCRSHKRRCDGKRPMCSNCFRGKRQCTFKETTTYSRARKRDLLQTVDVLEARLAELQIARAGKKSGKDEDVPPDQLQFCEAVPSGISSHASFLSEGSHSLSSTPRTDQSASPEEWWMSDPPAAPMQHHLLEMFLSNKERLLFYLHVGRFWRSLSPDHEGSPPLPGLLNAMYLLACYWSSDPALLSLQPHFLSLARRHQAETLGASGTCLVQWLQASCLLSFYLSDNCRCLEARQEISGAIPVLMMCRLHKITSSTWHPPMVTHGNQDMEVESPTGLLPPPKDSFELGERIWLFWMAYTFDLMISLVYGLEPNRLLVAETTTVWPRTFEEYEREFHRAVSVFLEGLPPIQYNPTQGMPSGASSPQINLVIFSIHTVTQFIHIQLYDAAGLESDVFSRLYDRRLATARKIALLTRAFISSGINPGRLPIMCTACWFPTASVLAQHARRLTVSHDETGDLKATQADLATMLVAVTELSKVFWIYTVALDRLQAYINGDSDTELSTSLVRTRTRLSRGNTPQLTFRY